MPTASTERAVAELPCYVGGHAAEWAGEQGYLGSFVYASHTGAWRYSCKEHSGLCHEECWPEEYYPDLRKRNG